MKKLVPILLVALLLAVGLALPAAGPAEAQVTLLSEDFESWPPPGWTIVNNGGDCVWESTATVGRPNYTGGGGNCADADTDWCGSGFAMDTELWTPVLDLSGVTFAMLEYKTEYQNFGGMDWAYVDISTDGGSGWTNLLAWNEDHPGPNTIQIDLTPYVGSANTIIRFHYDAPGWYWWWEVDDVVVVGTVPLIEVPVDIKPMSCPNAINAVGKGVLPVAILGTGDLEASQIDPATVQLEGVVAPLRWELEDVATPFEGAPCDCHELGPDGYLDLTLKFNMQEVIAALGGVIDGEVRELTLTGELLDGTPIIGQDCVLIRAR